MDTGPDGAIKTDTAPRPTASNAAARASRTQAEPARRVWETGQTGGRGAVASMPTSRLAQRGPWHVVGLRASHHRDQEGAVPERSRVGPGPRAPGSSLSTKSPRGTQAVEEGPCPTPLIWNCIPPTRW